MKKGLELGGKKAWAKVLRMYYGDVLKDMKVVGVAGEGAEVVAKMMFESLKFAGIKVALWAGNKEMSLGGLRKFLSGAWKGGADVVIVEVAEGAVEKGVFLDVPLEMLVAVGEEVLGRLPKVLGLKPKGVVACREDSGFIEREMASYGKGGNAMVRILNVKEYKRGTEAKLMIDKKDLTVASFMTGEKVGLMMAAAVAGVRAMGLENESAIEGISLVE